MVKHKKERGIFLTIWMYMAFISTIAVFILYTVFPAQLSQLVKVPIFSVYALAALSLVNVILIAFIFKWKKLAVYGIFVSAFIAFGINLGIGLDVWTSIYGLFGLLVWYLLLKEKWKLFE